MVHSIPDSLLFPAPTPSERETRCLWWMMTKSWAAKLDAGAQGSIKRSSNMAVCGSLPFVLHSAGLSNSSRTDATTSRRDLRHSHTVPFIPLKVLILVSCRAISSQRSRYLPTFFCLSHRAAGVIPSTVQSIPRFNVEPFRTEALM